MNNDEKELIKLCKFYSSKCWGYEKDEVEKIAAFLIYLKYDVDSLKHLDLEYDIWYDSENEIVYLGDDEKFHEFTVVNKNSLNDYLNACQNLLKEEIHQEVGDLEDCLDYSKVFKKYNLDSLEDYLNSGKLTYKKINKYYIILNKHLWK